MGLALSDISNALIRTLRPSKGRRAGSAVTNRSSTTVRVCNACRMGKNLQLCWWMRPSALSIHELICFDLSRFLIVGWINPCLFAFTSSCCFSNKHVSSGQA
uniref:Uncharacterized protein n=1 Tax=Candidatus Kentrum sp. LFY TaxID=2126342 RepID=A0A450VAU0_9GAMM|nr:MAG: hypothetical protein BECKLFY1418B_GA0070995_12791 [Candidatus Kentron sp. LFY]